MKIFVIDFSGTMKAVKLKRSTHMDSGLMYCVYRNQSQRPITFGVKSHDKFYNLPFVKEKLTSFTTYHH